MTTKARARKYRLRAGAPLVDGVDPAEAVRRAGLAAGGGAAGAANAAAAPAAGLPAPREDAPPGDPEAEIAAIRQEGLTGRQLRLARRVAQKHGIAATSDYDAVRQLRARGIDPFQRAQMLELVSVDQGRAQLPQTVPDAGLPAHPPPPGPAAAPKLPEDRAAEILKIQRDIARRRRRKLALLFARLAVFVLLPTLVVGWYYARVATPMYATHSEFVIQQADGQSAGGGGLGAMFQGAGLAMAQDSTTVQSYLMSRDAMRRLDEDLGFRAHFSQDWIDPIQRLDPDATNEEAYARYEKSVKVSFDPTEGILKMEVIAADPEVSQAFSEALIGYAEEQVDNLTRRLREDQMAGAMEAFAAAERRVAEAQERVLALQERMGVLDPASETGSLMQQITQFETELRTKQLELQSLLDNARPNEARVNAVRGEIERLQSLVDDLRGSMTESRGEGASLARVSGELRVAEADLTTRQLLLQQAAQQLETARIEANRQVRYMAVGVSPVAPDEPTYPRVFENTVLAFLIFAGVYLMISLTASVLREQAAA